MGTITYNPERSRREAAELLYEIAGEPCRPVKVALNRAMARIAPHLKLSYGRLRHIWYEDRLIRSHEMDALRLAAEDMRRKEEAGRAAASELAIVYRGAAERLRGIDADKHRAEIAWLECHAREIGPVARSGAAPGRVGTLPLSSNGGGHE